VKNHLQAQSCFAPAARKSPTALEHDVSAMAASPVVQALLRACGGLVAVLNAERQVVALNHALLAALGVRDPGEALGLRPGEALRCVHCRDHPAGCGCSEFCATCGAAIAIVAALERDEPQERDCIITVQRDGETTDLTFEVKASAIEVEGHDFVLVFLQDVTMSRLQSELSRVFFHDVSNLVQALQGACELLAGAPPDEAPLLTDRARILARRLAKEVAIQRALLDTSGVTVPMQMATLDAGAVLSEVHTLFVDHPLAFGKVLQTTPPGERWRVRGDRSLLVRVIANMVANALEATASGGTVRLWCQRQGDALRFCVHNPAAMPREVAARIFQRHFTTKGGSGRGLGTYAMKLLGERHLGGKVDFETDPSSGTIFRIALPLEH
jgi:signal transduction histidine kinase